MTIQQVVTLLQQEKQDNVPSRFPCRAIMVNNIKQYCNLLSELKKISDIRVISSDELFSSADVLPKYDNLKGDKYHNEWVILTGVSEYLRLFSKKEADDPRFASLWGYQAPATSIGRIIIPLWGCEAQWFDKSINLNGDLRQQDFFFDCSDSNLPEGTMSLVVLSGIFEQYLMKLNSMKGNLKIGLLDWFEYWEKPLNDNNEFVLLTKRCNSISSLNGNVSIHVISNILEFIKENMHGSEILNATNCSHEMQNILFDYALKGDSLNDALLKIFNVSTFSGFDIMSKWNSMEKSYKELVSLWFKLNPDYSYLCHCFNISPNISKISDCIMHEIFKVRNEKPEWISEFKTLSSAMKLTPDSDFFDELNKIPEYETKLDFIKNDTREERIYLLRVVGNWLRKDPAQVYLSDKLKSIYPQLYSYLRCKPNLVPDEIDKYMSRYKAYKLENTLPDDEDTFFNNIQTDTFESRFSLLSNAIDSNSYVFWIDALGIEWLPLLYWSLCNNCEGTIASVEIAQATLPTRTHNNEQWLNMGCPHKKLNKLDKLAHKGVIDDPDYYTCIEEQIEFVSNICKDVSKLLNQYHRVILTGDHGTSRLAARFFHLREGFDAPKGAVVKSHGRYCEMSIGSSIMFSNTCICKDGDKQYIVFKNYDHFKQPGFAAGNDDENAIYGEIHGGATPEELLVPVIVIESKQEIPLSGKWKNETVKISMRKAKLSIEFTRPVSKLSMVISGINGVATTIDNGVNWNVIFDNIKPDTYSVQVIADNCIINMPNITIKPALGGEDGDLP